MNSQSKLSDRPLRRHDLVYLKPAGWRELRADQGGLSSDSVIALWMDLGWPLVVRRALANEPAGVALGLPLPPCAGKRRLALVAPPELVRSTAPPLMLASVRPCAPHGWRATLDALEDLACWHRVEAHVFGSLAWRAITGLDYLTQDSDLDILLRVQPTTDLAGLIEDLAEIEAGAPMRLDGELIRGDGAGANWREICRGTPDILMKSPDGVALLDARSFLSQETA